MWARVRHVCVTCATCELHVRHVSYMCVTCAFTSMNDELIVMRSIGLTVFLQYFIGQYTSTGGIPLLLFQLKVNKCFIVHRMRSIHPGSIANVYGGRGSP